MARPTIGSTGHGLATCKGVANCGQGPLQRPTGCGQGPLHRRRPATASLQGWQAHVGTAACSAVPAGAAGYRVASARGGRQQPACMGLLTRGEAAGVAPARGLAARVGCSRRGHRGSACPRLGRKGRLLARGKRRT
ncbi:hypothetical protein BHE74_00022550 [Ensete ventricosum]|nr:hypothetical protein BHE74_00022550 [Ensete ventricosum]RZS14030.1 hypothetical protein BHM03_00045681 [Ensete ventricosum]